MRPSARPVCRVVPVSSTLGLRMIPALNVLIQQRRSELGLTQAQLARALGVTTQAVWNWENQANRSPSRDVLPRLASVLDLTLDSLMPAPEAKAPSNEAELLAMFRRLQVQEQEFLLRLIRGLRTDPAQPKPRAGGNKK